MENKIIVIILGIFLISIVCAVDYNILSGETIYIDLNQSYVNYTIEGASYSDFNISNNGTIVTIETSKYLQSLSFEITFFNEKGEAIQKYGPGGSSVKTYKEIEKEKLVNGVSIKEEENIPEDEEVPEENYFSNITGAIIGIMKNKSLIFILSFMILLIIIYIIVRKKIKNGKIQKE